MPNLLPSSLSRLPALFKLFGHRAWAISLMTILGLTALASPAYPQNALAQQDGPADFFIYAGSGLSLIHI